MSQIIGRPTEQRVTVPSVHLDDGTRSVENLVVALAPAWETEDTVTLDFHRCRFISAEGVALLAALKRHRDAADQVTMLDWETVVEPISKQFGRWEFGDLFGVSTYPWTDNAIPLLCCDGRDKEQQMNWIDRRFIGHPEIPDMDLWVQKRTRRSFYDLIENVFRHAASQAGCLVIGQVYPRGGRRG